MRSVWFEQEMFKLNEKVKKPIRKLLFTLSGRLKVIDVLNAMINCDNYLSCHERVITVLVS